MIEIMDKDDDEIDLVFQAFAKRIKKNLNEEQEDLMEELSACITKHVKMSRVKKGKMFKLTLSHMSCHNSKKCHYHQVFRRVQMSYHLCLSYKE